MTWDEHLERCFECRKQILATFCKEHHRANLRSWMGQLKGSGVRFRRSQREWRVSGDDILYSDGVGHRKLPWFACLNAVCSVHVEEKLRFYRSSIRRRVKCSGRYWLEREGLEQMCADGSLVGELVDVEDVVGGRLGGMQSVCTEYDELDTAEDCDFGW